MHGNLEGQAGASCDAGTKVAEGEGFEPPDGLPHLLISSQVPLTAQPPFPPAGTMNQSKCPEASPTFPPSVVEKKFLGVQERPEGVLIRLATRLEPAGFRLLEGRVGPGRGRPLPEVVQGDLQFL